MIKTVLFTAIFLMFADIVFADGRHSAAAGHIAAGLWYGIAGR